MDHQQQQQQQQQQERRPDRRVHGSILDAIASYDANHQTIRVEYAYRVDCHSVQYLVDFLQQEHSNGVKELELLCFNPVEPSDGGMGILREFFANDSKLTKVEFEYCDFSRAEEASDLLAAFQRNRSVTDLTITGIFNLEGAALCACVSALLENNTVLETLALNDQWFDTEASRALRPGLAANRSLKTLCLSYYSFSADDTAPIANALAEHTTLEKLDISVHDISYNRLISATTRLVESSRLKEIKIGNTGSMSCVPHRDKVAVRHLLLALDQNTSLERLHGRGLFSFPEEHESISMRINNILSRNRSLSRAKALLTLQPRRNTDRTRLPIASKSGIWPMAMAQLAPPPDSFGASSIFHILQTRPALLERQLLQQQQPQPPAPSSSSSSSSQPAAENASRAGQVASTMEREQHVYDGDHDNNNNNNNNQSHSAVQAATSVDGRKRARLS